jgi:general secretion pathway protein G
MHFGTVVQGQRPAKPALSEPATRSTTAAGRTACARVRRGPTDPRRRTRGFTLLELMLVVMLVAILAAIAVPSYEAHLYKTQVAQAAMDIRALATKVDLYYTDNGQYPPDLTGVGCTATTCIDPWGYAYQYIDHALLHGNGKVRRDRNLNPLNNDYDLFSIGIDGQTALPITQKVSQDDVIRASSGAYYGLASAF